MTKQQIYLLFLIIITLWGCTSTNTIKNNKMTKIQNSIKREISNSRVRDEKEALDFQIRLHKLQYDNPNSDTLLKYLQINGYIEEDIRKCFSEKIAKTILEEFFGEKYKLFSTDYIQIKINNISFSAAYLYEHMDIPNIASFVYVTENNNPEKMRLFYKVNYSLEYSAIGTLNNGKECYIFY
ncbi:hypothetical protein H0R92_10900 [Treponema sp. OMZ 840]|uniref:hypothetical protein n=1 Tax=Treponema sp. OMZ 840 TaxID=244313 RepID=UPI003D928216